MMEGERRQVYMRVKRKRDDSALESILVETNNNIRPSKRRGEGGAISDMKSMTAQMEQMQTVGQAILFQRVNTMDYTTPHEQMASVCEATTFKQPSASTQAPSTTLPPRLQAIGQITGSLNMSTNSGENNHSKNAISKRYCFVDLESTSIQRPVKKSSPMINSKKRILNPKERLCDEGIWHAYQKNDFSLAFAHLDTSTLNFQRPSDGLSLLMVAAHHGRYDVLHQLEALKTTVYELFNARGDTASDMARYAGHLAMASLLREREENDTDDEYVYDVYCTDGAVQPVREDLPTASVSSEVEEWLTHGDLLQSEMEHKKAFQEDDDSSGYGSEDSNDENYFHNEYPDEEESQEEKNSDSDSDDDY